MIETLETTNYEMIVITEIDKDTTMVSYQSSQKTSSVVKVDKHISKGVEIQRLPWEVFERLVPACWEHSHNSFINTPYRATVKTGGDHLVIKVKSVTYPIKTPGNVGRPKVIDHLTEIPTEEIIIISHKVLNFMKEKVGTDRIHNYMDILTDTSYSEEFACLDGKTYGWDGEIIPYYYPSVERRVPRDSRMGDWGLRVFNENYKGDLQGHMDGDELVVTKGLGKLVHPNPCKQWVENNPILDEDIEEFIKAHQ